MPGNIYEALSDASRSEEALFNRVDQLERENLVLQAKLQQMVALRAENTRLRALMNAGPRERNDVLATEIIAVAPNPNRQIVAIDHGTDDRVFLGQPLIDSEGLLGQVIKLAPDTAQVLLISDASHSVPVQIIRNSVRAIAEGTGDLNRLRIEYLSTTTDVEIGDQLVTSGLGGRFPMGYPVAKVVAVERADGERFATVWAQPLAQLSKARHGLLLFPEGTLAADTRMYSPVSTQ
jgi:rod shape-determining protein MreC